MIIQTKTKNNSLVEIPVDSRLAVVGLPLETLDVTAGQQALLIEKVGNHPDGLECWHALVEGKVILLWSDAFVTRRA